MARESHTDVSITARSLGCHSVVRKPFAEDITADRRMAPFVQAPLIAEGGAGRVGMAETQYQASDAGGEQECFSHKSIFWHWQCLPLVSAASWTPSCGRFMSLGVPHQSWTNSTVRTLATQRLATSLGNLQAASDRLAAVS